MEGSNKINILGITYVIEEVEVVRKDTFLLGEIDYITQVIKIDKSLSKEKKQQTLLHEILHGILENLGLDEINSDENAVQSIAATLHHVLTSNTITSF